MARKLNYLAIKGKYTVEVLPKVPITLMAHKSGLDNRLITQGFYFSEPYSKAIWLRLVQQAHTILDVGANIGQYTLSALAANPQAQVHAFEPIPANMQVVQTNLAQNPGFARRCTLHAYALSNKEQQIFYPAHWQAGYQIGSIFSKEAPNATGTNYFETKIFDSLGLPPFQLAKIDVETAEEYVLRGMQQSIQAHRPILLVEILKPNVHEPIAAMIQAWGYQWLQVDDVNQTTHPAQPFIKAQGDNFLLFPPEKEDMVRQALHTPHS